MTVLEQILTKLEASIHENPGTPLDLLGASKTFRSFSMVDKERETPSPTRATLGRAVQREIENNPSFSEVHISEKLSANRALQYYIPEEQSAT